MGLEFELAADILRTSVARNEIGYCFLEREIRREPEPQPREA